VWHAACVDMLPILPDPRAEVRVGYVETEGYPTVEGNKAPYKHVHVAGFGIPKTHLEFCKIILLTITDRVSNVLVLKLDHLRVPCIRECCVGLGF